MSLPETVQKWRENMAKPQELDPDFEAFLEEEAREIDELLASLEEKEGIE